ncbi:MAG: hypothetical protein PF795_08875 [Kiritimatiellae bacterium]|nr:hypothetical protein [Kiritimatiellia bacterium]
MEDLARHLFPGLGLVVMQGSNRLDSGHALAEIRSFRTFCRAHRIETLVCLRHSLTGMDHVLLNWLDPSESSGIVNTPIPAATPGPYRRFQFTHQPDYPQQRGTLPLEVHAHLSVVNCGLNITTLTESDCQPFLNLPTATPPNPPELAIFPVTRSRLRNYPLTRLAMAVNGFMDTHPDFRVHVYGTKTDETEINSFKSLLHPHYPITIEYPASILDAASRIQNSSLLLCMESAPAHIAAILDIPMVCILGGGHFDYFAPWGTPDHQIWIKQYLPCYHCNWNCKFAEPFCITKIDEQIVSENLLKLANMKLTSS